jgi:hypothetical protein
MGTVIADRPPATRTDGWTRAQVVVVGVSIVAGTAVRLVGLGSAAPSFDESFTAAYSGLPLSDLPSALAHNDSHPPLDYLLRHLFATTDSTTLLRLPSVVFGVGALLVAVLWMRHRGWFGAAVVGAMALDPFLVLHSRSARMYALLSLLGVVVAFASDRWLCGRAERRWTLMMAVALALAMFTHAGGLLLGVGVLVVAGTRRDRVAWEWRAGALGAGVVWAALWGPSLAVQMDAGPAPWIPATTPGSVDAMVSGLVTPFHPLWLVVTGSVIAGGLVLRSVGNGRDLARVWWALFAAPVAAACLIGIWVHLALPRTLSASAWAAPVAIVALLAWMLERWRPLGVAGVILLTVVTARSLQLSVSYEEDTGPAMEALAARLVPGDGVVISPGWLWPAGYTGVGVGRDSTPIPGVPELDAFTATVPGAPFSGRVWEITPDTYGSPLPAGWAGCPGEVDLQPLGWRVGCRVAPPP